MAVLASTAGENYFHWLFDVLPRMRLLGTEPCDWVYVQTELPFQQEALRRVGVPPSRWITAGANRHLQADVLIAPSLPGNSGQVTAETRSWLRGLLMGPEGDLPGRGGSRLFISRMDARIRRLENEAEVIRVLETRGFEVLRLAGRSMAEQAAIFAGARAVVGMHGAGLSNLVFCAPGTRVLELFSEAYLNPCYRGLCDLGDLEYMWLAGPPAPPLPSSDVERVECGTRIDPARILRVLDDWGLR
jgi:capsular polysaccharide biosynthesis protein